MECSSLIKRFQALQSPYKSRSSLGTEFCAFFFLFARGLFLFLGDSLSTLGSRSFRTLGTTSIKILLTEILIYIIV